MLELFPDRGQIRFVKVRDAGGVLNAVVAFVRRNARELLVGFFALVAPFAIISGIGSLLYLRRFGDLLADPAALEDPSMILELFGPAYFVSLLSGVLAFAFAQAAVAGYVRLYREGEAGEITVGLLWDETKRLILPVVGLFLTMAGLLIGSVLVVVIPCLGALVWLGFWVWLMPYAHVAYASRMTESTTLGDAVRRSLVLVKGSWGWAFGTLVLTWIVAYAIILAISIPLSMMTGIVGLNSTSTDPAAAFSSMGVWMVPTQIVGMVAYILPSLGAFFVHGRLVEELDGSALDDDLDLLEQGVEAAPNTAWDEPPRPSGPEPRNRLWRIRARASRLWR